MIQLIKLKLQITNSNQIKNNNFSKFLFSFCLVFGAWILEFITLLLYLKLIGFTSDSYERM